MGAAKVYGKAAVGAPPMSVPHLDTRWIDGQRSLLFGPFAGFSSKFLKEGSLLDLPGSVRPTNLLPMLQVGATNVDLVKYLINELRQSPEQRQAAQATGPSLLLVSGCRSSSAAKPAASCSWARKLWPQRMVPLRHCWELRQVPARQ